MGKYDFNNIKEFVPITKVNILKAISPEEIFRHYLGFDFACKKLYLSPLRDDKKPTFGLYYNSRGELRYKDFNGSQGSCFDLVMQKYRVDFYEALQIINRDFSLGFGSFAERKGNVYTILAKREKLDYTEFKEKFKSKNTQIQFKPQLFTTSDIGYWLKYGITKDTLVKFNVYSAKYVFLRKQLVMYYNRNCPVYCYVFPDNRVKVYRPLASKFRWLSNTSSDNIQGRLPWLKEEGSIIITKSMKDVMCLYEMGYKAVAPQGETQHLSKAIIEDFFGKFNKIYILFDNDEAGISGARNLYTQLSPHFEGDSLSNIMIPIESECKDISDFYAMYGREETLNLLTRKIKNYERVDN